MSTVATDPATKALALQRAREVGAAEASRETGVPAGTIRSWIKRDGGTVEPSGDASLEQIEQSRRTMVKARAVAEQAIDRLSDVISTGRSPQSLALAAGILIDKAQQLDDRIQALDEGRVQIAKRDAEYLIACVKTFLIDGLGLEWEESPFRAAWGGMFQNLVDTKVVTLSPDKAEACRVELDRLVRARIEVSLRAELEAELRLTIEQELREAAVASLPPLELLPAGGTSDMEPQRLAAPVRRWVSEPLPVVERPRDHVHVRGRVVRALARPAYSESEFG